MLTQYKPKATSVRRIHPVYLAFGVALLVVFLIWMFIELTAAIFVILLGLVLILLAIHRQLECPYCGCTIRSYRINLKLVNISCSNCSYRSQVDSEEKLFVPLDELLLPTAKSKQPPEASAGLSLKAIKIEMQERDDLEQDECTNGSNTVR